jgi:hypothetical protein
MTVKCKFTYGVLFLAVFGLCIFAWVRQSFSGISEEKYEDAFSRMKKAAGVSDIDEVVRRFQTQEETAKHLHELQARSEKEIRDLGAVKEKLEAEWEVVKYMGQASTL